MVLGEEPYLSLLTPNRGAVSDSRFERVKLFADGADLEGILSLYADPEIRGFTTNPTLMRQAGIEDYEMFARGCSKRCPTGRSRSRCSPTTRPTWSARR